MTISSQSQKEAEEAATAIQYIVRHTDEIVYGDRNDKILAEAVEILQDIAEGKVRT